MHPHAVTVMHSLRGAQPVKCGIVVTCCVLLLYLYILMLLLAAEPRSTAGLLFSSQYLRETILVTLYLMVWDWRVKRKADAFILAQAARSLLSLFSISLISLYGFIHIVGLRSSDLLVTITIFQPYITHLL